jgi:hypothetical protein
MKTFYEQRRDENFKIYFSPVAGETITFPGFEDFNFFIHEAHDYYDRAWDPEETEYWYDVHEAKTGMRIAGGETKEQAARNALGVLKKNRRGMSSGYLNKMLSKYGTSPLFRNHELR